MLQLKKIILATLAVILLTLTACVARSSQEDLPTPTLKPPIDLTLKDLKGNTVHLRDLRGDVLLVNYWASWCSPCREEMPILDAFYKKYRSNGFVLLSINVSEGAEEAADYIEAHGYSFLVWSDPPGNTMIELGINGLPASLMLDETGRIQKVWFGPLTEEILEEMVHPLLND